VFGPIRSRRVGHLSPNVEAGVKVSRCRRQEMLKTLKNNLSAA
jgi:hypothetical protein